MLARGRGCETFRNRKTFQLVAISGLVPVGLFAVVSGSQHPRLSGLAPSGETVSCVVDKEG